MNAGQALAPNTYETVNWWVNPAGEETTVFRGNYVSTMVDDLAPRLTKPLAAMR